MDADDLDTPTMAGFINALDKENRSADHDQFRLAHFRRDGPSPAAFGWGDLLRQQI